MQQNIQYCTTADGVRLAYTITGNGAPPVVRTSHWFAHVDHDIESPIFRHFLLDLSRCHRLLRYDARGIGLSQRDNVDISFDKFVDDLAFVVDAARLDKFILFGLSQGAAQAIAYAARHPERVSHLILCGGYARGANQRANPDSERKRIELACALIRSGWGSSEESHRQFFTSQFIPDASKELQHSLNELQRVAATPEMAERFLMATTDVNVVADLPRIKCPTLVLHSTRDVRVSFALSQEIAAGIPGAKLVPLDSANHMIMAGEPAQRAMSDAIANFLGDPRVRGPMPGTAGFSERLEDTAKAIEQHWSVKFILVFAAISGCLIFFWEVWKILHATH